jgi:hypothetical protein
MTITLIGAGWLFNVKPMNLLSTPLNTYGDGQLLEFLLKINAHNFILPVNSLDTLNFGWPGISRPELYPQSDNLIYFLINSLSNLTRKDPVFILVFLAIIKFPLTSLTTYLTTRYIFTSKFSAFLISLLFPFVPYALIRAEGHFMLGQIWVIPFALSFPLFLLSKRDFFKRSNILKIYILVAFSSVFASLSGTYYFIFTLLTLFIALALVLGKSYINLSQLKTTAHKLTKNNLNRNVIRENTFLFLFPSFVYLIISFSLYRLINQDTFNSEQLVNNLLLIRDSRVNIESLIYSGNFPTLFSDLYFYFDHYFGTSFQSVASTFYSWEAGGIGPYFTSLFFITLALISVSTFFGIKRPKLNRTAPFAVLLIYFFFYFQGFGGTIFAEFVTPSIRAWGRISIFISFLSLLIIFLILESQLRNKEADSKFRILTWMVVSISFIYVFSWNLAYFKSFNLSRLSNSQIVEVYESEQSDLRGVFSSLSSLEDSCPVVVLPYYPFPEFDSPNDRLSDYDLLALPMFDVENKFKWNVGAIKWSEDDRWWSSLASDIPGFASADALTQISFASHYGACAIALNQGMFKTQDLEVKPSFLTQFECPLLGNFPNSTPANSWMVWDIRGKTCQDKILINAKLAPNTFPNDPDGPLLWRFTNISPEKYEANYPIFSSRSPVGIDFMSMSNKERADKPKLAIKIMENQQNEILNLKICVTEIEKMNEQCEEIEIKGNETDYQLKKYLTGKKHHINITPKTAQNEIKWAPLITY